jgi:membrane protease subunit HflK
VRDAFADVIKAGADQVRMKNQAEAYANDILPRARGNAFRLIQEAEAYKEQVIAKAEGEASRFTQVKDEYEKAPDITRERLYLDTMESVYQKSQKVMVDVENGGSNVLYLPLDRLRSSTKSLEQSSMDQFSFPSTGSSSTSSSSSTTDDARSRGGR